MEPGRNAKDLLVLVTTCQFVSAFYFDNRLASHMDAHENSSHYPTLVNGHDLGPFVIPSRITAMNVE